MLLEANADPNIRNKREQLYTIREVNTRIDRFCDTSLILKRRSRLFKHWSLLDIAVCRKNKYIVRLLKSYGAICYHKVGDCS